MSTSIEAQGVTVDEAIQVALNQLGVSRDSVEIKIVHHPRGGFLGIGARKAKVRATSRVVEHTMVQPYVCVVVRARFDGQWRTGFGFAKCHPNDAWDEHLGYTIAKGRAEAQIARRIAQELGTNKEAM